MNKNLFYLSLLLIFLSSCSFFSNKIENLTTNESSETKDTSNEKNPKSNIDCTSNDKIQLLLEDESTQKYYSQFSSAIFETNKLSFIQKSVMLSLIEMSRRPDVISPSSRFQYFLHYNQKDYYFDFRPKNLNDNTKMSFLKGLDYLIATFDRSKDLIKLSEILNQLLPANVNVTPELETFLLENKNKIISSGQLSSYFVKGDDVITRYETFKRLNFKKVISLYYNLKLRNDNLYNSSTKTFYNNQEKTNTPHIKCNFDLTSKDTLKMDTSLAKLGNNHSFAIKEADNYFIATTSNDQNSTFVSYKDLYLINTIPASRPIPFCQIKTSSKNIVLFSTKDRSPEQHLKHLIAYDIASVDSYQHLDDLLSFSRHLFLTLPDRILYESSRGRKSQLDFFLNMNFPIYHVDSLGNITGAAQFGQEARSKLNLIPDRRSNAKVWCKP